ncbi:unnamed protein product, partial [Phaeothamnion confervicola]
EDSRSATLLYFVYARQPQHHLFMMTTEGGEPLLSAKGVERLTSEFAQGLREGGAYDRIRNAIQLFVQEARGACFEEDNGLVLEEVVRSIENKLGICPTSLAHGAAKPAPKERVFLRVTVEEGRAFVGQLADDRTVAQKSEFQVHIQFDGQRAATRRQVPASVEPHFGETFLFQLCDHVPRTAGEWAALLERHCPIHVCLTSQRARQPPAAVGTSTAAAAAAAAAGQ